MQDVDFARKEGGKEGRSVDSEKKVVLKEVDEVVRRMGELRWVEVFVGLMNTESEEALVLWRRRFD